MRLRTKLPLFTSITVLISIAAIAIYSIIDFRNKTIESIEVYRTEETEQIMHELKDIVGMAYAMVDLSFRSTSREIIIGRYGLNLQDTSEQAIRMVVINTMKFTLENLRVLRFGVDGYIWINHIDPPFPVVMHATRPSLEGGSHVFYIDTTHVNVYQAFADAIHSGGGEGYLTYNFYKPDSKERVPKLSYIKLYEPLGWVIGTGVYIDHIDKMVAKKTAELNHQINSLILGIIVIGGILIIIASLALYFFGATITKPIFLIEKQLYDIANGKIVQKLDFTRKDEIGQMKKSLDALIDGFLAYSTFALEIGKGNYDSNFTTLSNEDMLGNSLLDMRNSLKKAQKEEERRKEENAKRQWATEGMAKFGDILRSYSGDLHKMTEDLLFNLIKYVKANQGGIFILNDEDPENHYLYQIASVAYNMKKYKNKKINIGDGLLGACFFEKETIYMTNVPNDYIEIKSGLGTSNPTNLILVPIKNESEVIGVIELASFNKFEKHIIEFLENIAYSTGISISSARVAERTQHLYEQLQKKSAEQTEQEIEVRKSLEELKLLKELHSNKNTN